MKSSWIPAQRSFERAIDDLAFPVRIVNAANARGLYTLREFLTLSPATFTTERNIGRKTLAETEQAIVKALGVSWHEAWSTLAGPATRTSMPPAQDPYDGESLPARWARLALHPRLASFRVGELPLPTRMKNHAARENILTALELVQHPWPELLQSERVGRGTMQKTLETLEATLATASRPDPLLEASHWREALSAMIGELEGHQRSILTRRAGLAAEVPSLAQIGDELGLSRERVRQLEERAKQNVQQRAARLPFGARLAALVAKPWTLITELGDPFFAAEPEDEPAYAVFFAALGAGIQLVELDARLCATRLSAADARALWARAEAVPTTLAYPLAEAELVPRFALAMPCTETDARAFVQLLDARFLRHDAEIHGFGTRREDAVLAYLRAQPGPVHRSELERQLGRGTWPEDVVLIERGMLTLRERVPAWDLWVERAGQLAAQAMREQAPERHWTTHELVPVLAEIADLPTWFNPWSLGALLKQGHATQYLGRNVVTLAGEPEVRTYLVDAVKTTLEAAGGPMPEREVHDQLLQARGLTDTTWSLLRLRAPFLLMDGAMLGLAPRDIPGGSAAFATLAQAIARALHEEQLGWDRRELEHFVRDFGAPYASWGQRSMRSVLRLSGLFRLTRAGGIGLAEWEHDRVPVRALDDATRVLREPSSAEVRASLLERWLIVLPERAARLARELAQEQPPHLEDDLRAWEASLRAVATWNTAVETEQVERLIEHAHALLACDGGCRLQTLARTALRYACVSEAARDAYVIGALDDEEAVLAATRDFVGHTAFTDTCREARRT